MSDWQPGLYLTFDKERTQPSIDLVARIDCNDPKRIIDVGCGPGNSTAVLKAKWPQAEIIGLDSSTAMIDEAKSKYPAMEWVCADAFSDLSDIGKFDIVFSSAAIQWIPDQDKLLAKLYGMLNENGVLAAQVPCTKHMAVQIELDKLASTAKWKPLFADVSSHSAYSAETYYDILCGLTPDIDLWETRYFHVMQSHSDIVNWYSGTGLRPYLDCLDGGALAAEFLADFEAALKIAYPIQADGKVLFPFTRIFFMAKK